VRQEYAAKGRKSRVERFYGTQFCLIELVPGAPAAARHLNYARQGGRTMIEDTCLVCHQPLTDEDITTNEYGEPVHTNSVRLAIGDRD